MSAAQPFYLMLDINLRQFSELDLLFLEAELVTRIYIQLKELIKNQNNDYFKIMKFNIEKEKTMVETTFIRWIINDILLTDEYNLSGIALYIDVPEDVIYELASGFNTNPTFLLAQKIIELHRATRPNLYREITNKIKREILIAA